MKNKKIFFVSILLTFLGLIVIVRGFYFYKENTAPEQPASIKINDAWEQPVSTEVNEAWEEHTDYTLKYTLLHPKGWWNLEKNLVTNPNNTNKSDTGTPQGYLLIKNISSELEKTLCDQEINSLFLNEYLYDSDWEIGYGLVYYRNICINEKNKLISLAVYGDEDGNINQNSKKILQTITFEEIKSDNTKINVGVTNGNPEPNYQNIAKETILNGNYYNSSGEIFYEFVNGEYDFFVQQGKDVGPDTPFERRSITIDKEHIALGNLMNNVVVSSAMVIGKSFGGSGYYNELLISKNVSEYPDAKPLFKIMEEISLGDRQKILSLKIEDELVKIEYLTQGEGEPLCCGTKRVSRTFKIIDDKVQEITLAD